MEQGEPIGEYSVIHNKLKWPKKKKKKNCYQKLSDKILNQIKQTVKDFKPNHQNNNLKNTFFNFFILLVIITKWPNNFYLCSHKTLHQNPISLPKNNKKIKIK